MGAVGGCVIADPVGLGTSGLCFFAVCRESLLLLSSFVQGVLALGAVGDV